MIRTTLRYAAGCGTALVLLAAPAPAGAQLPDLPVDLPDLPVDLPDGLPGDPPGGSPGGGLPGGGLPGLPIGLPGGAQGSDGTPGGGPAPGSGTAAGGGGDALGTGGATITGPSRAATVRVDSKGRFRIVGVTVTCPIACRLSTRVEGLGARFVKRTWRLEAGESVRLTKLKVSKKALRKLRAMQVARVVAHLKASSAGARSVKRGVSLKLKPARS